MHTPGPWEWDSDVCNYDREQMAPWLVAKTKDVLMGEIRCSNKDDANLIAAAPELLEALQTIVNTHYGTLEMWNAIVSAKAAIAKALGQPVTQGE